MKKVLKSLLALVLCAASVVTAFSASSLGALADNSSLNDIEVIEINSSESRIEIEYFLTTNGNTTWHHEIGNIVGSEFNIEAESMDVDLYGSKVPETRTHISQTVSIQPSDASSPSISPFSTTEWKPYSETFYYKSSISNIKTVLAFASLLAGAIGATVPSVLPFAVDAFSILVNRGLDNVPDSVYFEGERCVSSHGKVYYRYRGNFYLDETKSVLLAENVSWSRRWGH